MPHDEITARLRSVITTQLTPLIDNDYVYLDLPYHENSGDLLIWEGTLAFLQGLPYRCLYSTNKSGYVRPPLSADKVILLHGGGNWGDIWPEHHEFRKRVIEDFPENRIIVLPQSVHYGNQASLDADVEFFSRHPSVIICVRDKESRRILSEALPNRILLVPDMAFCIDSDTLIPRYRSACRRILYARRLDKEMPEGLDLSMVPENAEIRDWPILENLPQALFRAMRRRLKQSRKPWNRLKNSGAGDLTDKFWDDVIRPAYIRNAVDFVGRYSAVYSTRLHVSILSILMGKELHVLDNSYGKTRHFLDTWIPGWEKTLAEPQPERDVAGIEAALPGPSDRYLSEDVEVMRYLQVKKAFHDSEISNRSAKRMLEDFARLYPDSKYIWKLRCKYWMHRVIKKSRYPQCNFSDSCDGVYAAGNRDDQRGVLLLSHEMTLTGAPRALLNLAVTLREGGYAPVIVSLKGGGLLREAEAAGIPAYVDPLMRYDFTWEREMRYRYVGSFPTVLFNTLDMMRYVENFIGLPCRKIGWIHESKQGYPKAGVEGIFGRYADSFDEIYCVSDYSRNEAFKQGVCKEKTGVLTFGIEPLQETGMKAHPADDDRDILKILVAGPVSEWKGCGVLAEALTALNQSVASKLRIVMAGRVVDKWVEEKLVSNNNDVKVILKGVLDHDALLNEMGRADVLLCPSLDESMSIVCIEAMQHGTPVVTTDATGIASFISDGENGFVIPAGDAVALERMLERLYEQRDRLPRIGARGYDVYTENFAPAVFARRVSEIFPPFSQA